MNYGLCAIAKNEDRYIREWVAFHLGIGFDRIVIYDNESSTPIAAASDEKELDVVRWPYVENVSSQHSAYDDYLAKHASSYDWVMFLDLDEFLNIKSGKSLQTFMRNYQDTDGVAINWRLFGSSGRIHVSDEPVLDRFIMASNANFGPNAHVKTIFRPEAAVRAGIHSPHFKSGARFVDTRRNTLSDQVDNMVVDIDLDIAQINHYFTKSQEEFEVKRARGKADHPLGSVTRNRRSEEFIGHDRNEVQDTSIFRNRTQKGSALMSEITDAVNWYKTLTTELQINANWGTPGTAGQWAQKRVKALIDLFFDVCDEMKLDNILEIGAHDAEASRRFVSSSRPRMAIGYDASPEVVARVLAQGLPERFKLHHRAVGTKEGEITFYKPNDPFYAVWGSTTRRAGFTDVTEISVPIITMDQAAEPFPGDSFSRDMALWVDVEGCALDVLRSGKQILARRIAVAYVELNDINAYEGSATAIDVIQLMLELGFVPLARDNEYPDAWNMMFVHRDYFSKPREAFARWTYKSLPQPEDA